MKIAFDHQIFTSQVYGGISRYYITLADHLIKKGEDIRIFAGLHQNNYLDLYAGGAIQSFGFSKYPLRTGKFFNLLNYSISNYQINNFKPDIVHETYYSSLSRHKKNYALVTTVHDMIHELYGSSFSKFDLTTKKKKDACHRADKIITVSDNTKKDLINFFGIDASKISVVHLGVDTTIFNRSEEILNDNKRPFLLYVGNRRGYKNFSSFIKAIASSPRLIRDFDVVAFGGGEFNSDEITLIRRLGFQESQVRQVVGDDTVLVNLYHQAVAFIYPSLYEGFGLPPLEAMASGCPVVSSNTSSMPEVIRDAAEYFNPNEIEDICRAIEKVVFCDSHRRELISSGLENVLSFSWQRCAQRTFDVYESLC